VRVQALRSGADEGYSSPGISGRVDLRDRSADERFSCYRAAVGGIDAAGGGADERQVGVQALGGSTDKDLGSGGTCKGVVELRRACADEGLSRDRAAVGGINAAGGGADERQVGVQALGGSTDKDLGSGGTCKGVVELRRACPGAGWRC